MPFKTLLSKIKDVAYTSEGQDQPSKLGTSAPAQVGQVAMSKSVFPTTSYAAPSTFDVKDSAFGISGTGIQFYNVLTDQINKHMDPQLKTFLDSLQRMSAIPGMSDTLKYQAAMAQTGLSVDQLQKLIKDTVVILDQEAHLFEENCEQVLQKELDSRNDEAVALNQQMADLQAKLDQAKAAADVAARKLDSSKASFESALNRHRAELSVPLSFLGNPKGAGA